MFKKREKNSNLLKRTEEDRYLEETQKVVEAKPAKRQKTDECCSHSVTASTKEHQHYRQEYIRKEVNDMAAFKTDSGNDRRENDATQHLEIDTAYENDALTHARQNIEISNGIKEGKIDPNLYRGLHGYQNYFQQTEEDLRNKKFSGTLGPVRAPTFIRNTTRVDYNPERCKDWYETGRCNFGDSCVFIHDRSDYKSGWQLDQEFEAEQKRKQLRLMGHEVDEGEENYEIHSEHEDGGLPSVCRICEQGFSNPVMTACGHYFCERCALNNYATSSNCFQCGKATNGIFNEAPKLTAKLVHVRKHSDDSEPSDDETTPADKVVDQSSSSDEEGGVLSKAEREMINDYKEKAREGNQKKYQSQNGWYIP